MNNLVIRRSTNNDFHTSKKVKVTRQDVDGWMIEDIVTPESKE